MRLTVHTDYALRVLMFLALNPDRLVRTQEISERFGISAHHLTKVAQSLGKQGIVETVRGRLGGLRLARPAERIIIGKVIRELEEWSPLVECFPNGDDRCLITNCCRLKRALAKAQEQFFKFLDGYTVEDLVMRNPALRAVL